MLVPNSALPVDVCQVWVRALDSLRLIWGWVLHVWGEGGGAPTFGIGFPGFGFGLGFGLGGRVICITLWISTFPCPAIGEGGVVCCRILTRSSLGGFLRSRVLIYLWKTVKKKATWWSCRKYSGKTKVM